MRLDPILESLHLLASLWSVPAGSQVCSARPQPTSLPAYEIIGAPVEAPAGTTAFVDVSVVPMDSERVLANHTVLVEGGRITAVGPMSRVEIPAAAVRVDGRGKYLIPGLADMHWHNSPSEAQLQAAAKENFLFRKLANGVTTVRHIEGRDDIDPRQLSKYFETSEVPLPRSYIAPNFPRSMTSDSFAAYVAAAKAAGYHHIGIGYRTPRAHPHRGGRAFFDSLMAAAREAGLPVASHADPGLPFDALLVLGTTGGSSEHVYTFLNALGYPPLYQMSDQPRATPDVAVPDVSMAKLRELAAATKRAGAWITPTLSCTEKKYSPHPTYATLLRQIVRALHDAGVGLLLSADDGWTVHDELASLVRAGLTPYQALATGTRNVAHYLGLQDSSGTIARGKWADLVLLSGNPLESISHTASPAGVMVAGRWLDRAALDRLSPP